MSIRVLVVEDEEIPAQVHADYVGRLEGFELVAVTRSARDAHRTLRQDPTIDLVLLDLNLPDGHGLRLVQQLHAEQATCDVLAVTAARDAQVVRRAIALGVVGYLIKPFTFAMFRSRLETYAAYRAEASAAPDLVVQHEVDQLLVALRPRGATTAYPKGINADTLRLVVDCLRAAEEDVSASELALSAGVSRVTARRYLEHLHEEGSLTRRPRYVASGRPETAYRWVDRGPA
ncbi:response regulator [Nocardioidaceae bacterium]|nr:response regulator [Nocardioidaceae bacterium]